MERVTILFDDDLLSRLRLFANERGKSLSAVIREVLGSYFEEYQNGAADLKRQNEIANLTDVTDQEVELLELAAQGKIRLGAGNGILDESFWDLPAPSVPMSVLQRVIEEERNED